MTHSFCIPIEECGAFFVVCHLNDTATDFFRPGRFSRGRLNFNRGKLAIISGASFGQIRSHRLGRRKHDWLACQANAAHAPGKSRAVYLNSHWQIVSKSPEFANILLVYAPSCYALLVMPAPPSCICGISGICPAHAGSPDQYAGSARYFG
jgi:hypothetical protein